MLSTSGLDSCYIRDADWRVETTIPHPFPYLIVISALTLILTVLAFHALNLRDELEKLRRVHSSTMTLITASARTTSIQRLKDSFKRRLQKAGVEKGSALSTAPPTLPSPADSKVAEAVCPLVAAGLPREMCPLMQAVAQTEMQADR